MLLEVLEASRRTLPTPDADAMRTARATLLRVAGLPSERKLQQTAVLCLVARDGDTLRFTPSHNGGTRGDRKGFHHRNDAAVVVPATAPPARVAEALREALRRCTSVFGPE